MPARSNPWPALITVLLALLGCRRMDAQSVGGTGGAAATALPTDPDVTHARLENGFSYLFKPAPNNGGAVELALVLRVGSAAEREDERGLAHFVEHVSFDQRFGELMPSEFARSLGMAIGPDANGSTTPWATSYKLVIPNATRETLTQGVAILRGFAGSARFDETIVERQRGIVAAELRSIDDRASAASWAHLFRGSRYADRAPGGIEAVVRAASAAQLEAFYRRWYRPQYLALVAVGQFEPTGLAQLVEQSFSSLPGGQAEPVPSFEVPLAPAEEVMLREAKEFGLEQSSFELISRLPASGLNSEHDFRRTLLDRCFASLIHARLARLWMNPSSPLGEEPAPDGMSESREGGFAAFSIRTRPKPGQLRAAIEVLLVELERVRQHGFTEAELASAQAEGARSLRRASDELSIQSETARLMDLFRSGDGRMSSAQTAAIGQRLLAQVDLPAVRERAAEWLGRSRRSLLALRAPADASLASEQDLQALVSQIRTRKLDPYHDAGPRQLMATLPDPGKIVGTEELDELKLRIWTLQNGAKVAFKPVRSGNDGVLLRAVSPGGRVHVSARRYDNARFAEGLAMDSGVGEHDIRTLFRLLEGTRVSVEPWLNDYFEGFHGSSAKAELELMLQLVHLYVTSPRADPGELERLRASLREPPPP
ncbi:MAG: insulinase family protein, partial [Deltaproteobacteria bacterium]